MYRYTVDYLGMVRSEEWGGVYVDIDNIVERKLTGWQVDAKTFTTRVGGVIGVGKNLLWVVILREVSELHPNSQSMGRSSNKAGMSLDATLRIASLRRGLN